MDARSPKEKHKMRKNKSVLAFGLVLSLGIVVVMSIMVGRAGSATVASVGDPDLLMPAANMALSANWKAQPVTSAPVSVPWPNIKVNNDNSSEAQNEPFAAVDPRNSQHLVVGANSWQAGNGHFEVFAYVSFDGGRTWTSSQPYINRNASRIDAADPTVAFGSDGSVYFAFVAMTPAQGAVAVSRSLDGGRTWASQSWATSFTGAADKPAVAFSNGNLHLYYQNGSLYTQVSRDNGATWGSSRIIDVAGRNANPVVDSKGGVNVFYNTSSTINLARLTADGSYTTSTIANAVALQPRAAHYRANIYARELGCGTVDCLIDGA